MPTRQIMLFAFVLAATSAFACECIPGNEIEWYFSADHIVVAKVVALEERDGESWVTVKVLEDIKNSPGGMVSFSNGKGFACSIEANAIGEKFLLVDGGEWEGIDFGYDTCLGSRRLTNADGTAAANADYGKKMLRFFRSVASGDIKRDWYSEADPVADANVMSESEHPRFYYLASGMEVEMPGIGSETAKRCYPSARQEAIGPAVLPEDMTREEKVFNEAARQYTAKFNRHLASVLQGRGNTVCELGEDWSSALEEVERFIVSVIPSASVGSYAWFDKATHRSFKIRTRQSYLKESEAVEICKILAQYNIAYARVETAAKITDGGDEYEDAFSCRSGEALFFEESPEESSSKNP